MSGRPTRRWFIDSDSGTPHVFKNLAAFDGGEPALCGAPVHVSRVLDHGELRTLTKCPDCVTHDRPVTRRSRS